MKFLWGPIITPPSKKKQQQLHVPPPGCIYILSQACTTIKFKTSSLVVLVEAEPNQGRIGVVQWSFILPFGLFVRGKGEENKETGCV